MDQELKQRLIGAAVVTALAAIFIPMLFDDPIDNSGQTVSEMTIPEPPTPSSTGPESKLKENPMAIGDMPETAANSEAKGLAPPSEVERIEPGLQEQSNIDYEPPAEVDPDLETRLDQAADGISVTPPEDNNSRAASVAIDKAGATTDPEVDSSQDLPVREETPPVPSPKVPIKRATSTRPAQTSIKPAHKSPAGESIAKMPPAAKPAGKFERYYVQAGSFTKQENALTQMRKLQKLGMPAGLETQNTDKGTMYRIKIGPELSKERAIEFKSRLSQEKIPSIILAQ